jgi:CBS domain-containing protein
MDPPANHPYQNFPVFHEGKLLGMATRKAIASAIAEKKPPDLLPLVSCPPRQSVHDIADKFIGSPASVIVVMDDTDRGITGIVTLHDLLRAQASLLD